MSNMIPAPEDTEAIQEQWAKSDPQVLWGHPVLEGLPDHKEERDQQDREESRIIMKLKYRYERRGIYIRDACQSR